MKVVMLSADELAMLLFLIGKEKGMPECEEKAPTVEGDRLLDAIARKLVTATTQEPN